MAALAELHAGLRELADAIAVEVNDERWSDAAIALDAAATWVRAPVSHTHRADARRYFPTATKDEMSSAKIDRALRGADPESALVSRRRR
jgi:hypothetical protein